MKTITGQESDKIVGWGFASYSSSLYCIPLRIALILVRLLFFLILPLFLVLFLLLLFLLAQLCLFFLCAYFLNTTLLSMKSKWKVLQFNIQLDLELILSYCQPKV